MGPIGWHETSVRNYHYTLRNNAEAQISAYNLCGKLVSKIVSVSTDEPANTTFSTSGNLLLLESCSSFVVVNTDQSTKGSIRAKVTWQTVVNAGPPLESRSRQHKARKAKAGGDVFLVVPLELGSTGRFQGFYCSNKVNTTCLLITQAWKTQYICEDGIGVLTKPRSDITNTTSVGVIGIRNIAQMLLQDNIDGSLRLYF